MHYITLSVAGSVVRRWPIIHTPFRAAPSKNSRNYFSLSTCGEVCMDWGWGGSLICYIQLIMDDKSAVPPLPDLIQSIIKISLPIRTLQIFDWPRTKWKVKARCCPVLQVPARRSAASCHVVFIIIKWPLAELMLDSLTQGRTKLTLNYHTDYIAHEKKTIVSCIFTSYSLLHCIYFLN